MTKEQGCSPRDQGLESTGDWFFEVLVSKGRPWIYFPDRPIYLFQTGK